MSEEQDDAMRQVNVTSRVNRSARGPKKGLPGGFLLRKYGKVRGL